MNAEILLQELEREPFVPMRIHLVDGRHIDIFNPGLCFINRLSLYVFAAKPNRRIAEDVQLISLRGMASIEKIAPHQAA